MKTAVFGTKEFYRKTFRIVLPIMLQNAITNVVGMLDNIMVGRVGTDTMSGVAIVNQLLFVYNLCVLGGLAGIGIFTAQYYGKGDEEKIRGTVRLQVIFSFLLTAAGLCILKLFSGQLISLYLHSDGGVGDAAMTMRYAKEYLLIMYAGLLPFAFSQMYATTLRATGETVIPMYAGAAAVLVNLAGNYVLIFGRFGIPAMGAAGAALATVISRFVELALVAVWTHLHTDRFSFIRGVYQKLFSVPRKEAGRIMLGALPLLVNEALWSGAQAALNQSYSVRGLSVVAALNISGTIVNVFNGAFIAMGDAVAIMVGQRLGRGELSEARTEARWLSVLSVLSAVLAGGLLLPVSFWFPRIYNTSAGIRSMSGSLIRISALFMPACAYCNACYFTLRSGGRTGITFLFDSCYVWLVGVPTAWILANMTGIPILPMYAIVQMTEVVKCLLGWRMTASGIWVRNLTETGES